MRVDHIPIEEMLLGVWPVSYSGECDLNSREIDAGCHRSQRNFDRQKSEA